MYKVVFDCFIFVCFLRTTPIKCLKMAEFPYSITKQNYKPWKSACFMPFCIYLFNLAYNVISSFLTQSPTIPASFAEIYPVVFM